MSPNPINILHIHGGDTFPTREAYLDYLRTRPISLGSRRRWIDGMQSALGDGFSVTAPRMPLQDDAKYDEWKIVFERYLAAVSDGPYVLTGGSLGGVFLARYLSENVLPRPALGVFLVCPPFDDRARFGEGWDMSGFCAFPESLDPILAAAPRVTFFFSDDDPVVPLGQAQKYREKLPTADIRVLSEKNGHFVISEFPELVEEIRAAAASIKQ